MFKFFQGQLRSFIRQPNERPPLHTYPVSSWLELGRAPTITLYSNFWHDLALLHKQLKQLVLGSSFGIFIQMVETTKKYYAYRLQSAHSHATTWTTPWNRPHPMATVTIIKSKCLTQPESNPWPLLNLLKVSSVSLSMDDWRILRVLLELGACKENRHD